MVERLVAKRCSIGELLSGRYVIKEGSNPNHVVTPRGPVSRVNVIATVVSKQGASALLDDGTGTIEARAFNNPELFANVAVGSVILFIGRPREYNDARYLVAEIAKPLNSPLWLALRKAELDRDPKTEDGGEESQSEIGWERREEVRQGLAKSAEKEEEKIVVEREKEQGLVTAETILAAIKERDAGDGVAIEEVLAATGCSEEALTLLLAEGEIYEKRPGRLKVL